MIRACTLECLSLPKRFGQAFRHAGVGDEPVMKDCLEKGGRLDNTILGDHL